MMTEHGLVDTMITSGEYIDSISFEKMIKRYYFDYLTTDTSHNTVPLNRLDSYTFRLSHIYIIYSYQMKGKDKIIWLDLEPKNKPSWNNSSVHINMIMRKLWLSYSPKDLQKLRIYPWLPFNLIALDEMLLKKKLYDDNKMSMKEYIKGKLDKELYNHFITLFWIDD